MARTREVRPAVTDGAQFVRLLKESGTGESKLRIARQPLHDAKNEDPPRRASAQECYAAMEASPMVFDGTLEKARRIILTANWRQAPAAAVVAVEDELLDPACAIPFADEDEDDGDDSPRLLMGLPRDFGAAPSVGPTPAVHVADATARPAGPAPVVGGREPLRPQGTSPPAGPAPHHPPGSGLQSAPPPVTTPVVLDTGAGAGPGDAAGAGSGEGAGDGSGSGGDTPAADAGAGSGEGAGDGSGSGAGDKGGQHGARGRHKRN